MQVKKFLMLSLFISFISLGIMSLANAQEENAAVTININTATSEELESLKGIGKARALIIVKYREEHGNFASIEDINNVPGIGEAVFADIKDQITVGEKSEATTEEATTEKSESTTAEEHPYKFN